MTLTGTTGNDTLTGAEAPDTITGLAGSDVLRGGAGDDSLDGALGNDTLTGGLGADTLATGDGSDRVVIAAGDSLPGAFDRILDWNVADTISFGPTAGYVEATAVDATAARNLADQYIGGGDIDYVAVQVGADVIVFADTLNNNGRADDGVILVGRTLDDVSRSDLLNASSATQSTVTGLNGTITGNIDLANFGALAGAPVIPTVNLQVLVNGGPTNRLALAGANFTYDANQQLTGGQLISMQLTSGDLVISVSASNTSVTPFFGWIQNNASQDALVTLFSQNDRLSGIAGAPAADLIRGFGGNDTLAGNNGADTIFGGIGNDRIFAGAEGGSFDTAQTFLRGEDGDDFIVGGAGFDDTHGNMGNDTVSGGEGNDYVVGGQHNDMLFGGLGVDLVYGNLGDDTCAGDGGNDVVRGGQGNDSMAGGAGDDFMSGDRGDDTMTGGDGVDTFNVFGLGGIDRILDFNGSEDHIRVEGGATYTVSQVGLNTVIDIEGGAQVTLVGVQQAQLLPGWIFSV